MSCHVRFGYATATLTTLVLALTTFRTVTAAPPASVRFSKRCLMISPTESCAIADVNRDSKPDIIAGTHWFPAPDFTPHLLRDVPVHRVEYLDNNGDHPYDVNADGWIDVISIGFMRTELCWYENPGKKVLLTGRKWQRHVLVDTTRVKNELTMPHDFDGDGVPEIFINSWNRKDPVVAWKMVKSKDGKPTAKEIILIDKSWSQAHCLAWADLNGDGQSDLITGKRRRAHCGRDPGGNEPACMYYYTWDKQAGKFTRHTISSPGDGVGIGVQFAVGDLNGNGRSDIAVAGKTGTWVLFNDGVEQ